MDQTLSHQMTAEDLASLPSGMGKRYELVEGELVEMAAAGGKHGHVAGNFLGRVFAYLENNPIGQVLTAETGFYTRGDENTVRAPDMAFIRSEQIPESGIPDGYLHIIPDLVVEVVSPTDRAAEVEQKVQEWLTFGVRLVWVAYPSTQRVMAYQAGLTNVAILNERDALDGRDVLPGFSQKAGVFFK